MIQKFNRSEFAAKQSAGFGDHRMIASRLASGIFTCATLALTTNRRTFAEVADAEAWPDRKTEVLFGEAQKLLGVSAVLKLIAETRVGCRKRKPERGFFGRRGIGKLIAVRVLKETCQEWASAADVLNQALKAAWSCRGSRSGKGRGCQGRAR